MVPGLRFQPRWARSQAALDRATEGVRLPWLQHWLQANHRSNTSERLSGQWPQLCRILTNAFLVGTVDRRSGSRDILHQHYQPQANAHAQVGCRRPPNPLRPSTTKTRRPSVVARSSSSAKRRPLPAAMTCWSKSSPAAIRISARPPRWGRPSTIGSRTARGR